MKHPPQGGSKVVQIGRQDKGGQRNGPQQSIGITCLDPFVDEVEAAVGIQYLNDRHRSQQVHHDGSSLSHVFQEDAVINKVLYGIAAGRMFTQKLCIGSRMHVHHEISTPDDINHPPYGSQEDADGGLVHTSEVRSRNQQIAEQQKKDDNQGHGQFVFLPLIYLPLTSSWLYQQELHPCYSACSYRSPPRW